MPSVSSKQKRFMGAELARLRAGEPTDTGMDEAQLTDFTQGPAKDLPAHAKPKHKKHTPPHSGGRMAKPRGSKPY